jgi:hypothetical protein
MIREELSRAIPILHAVVRDDVFDRSRVTTVIVCALIVRVGADHRAVVRQGSRWSPPTWSPAFALLGEVRDLPSPETVPSITAVAGSDRQVRGSRSTSSPVPTTERAARSPGLLSIRTAGDRGFVDGVGAIRALRGGLARKGQAPALSSLAGPLGLLRRRARRASIQDGLQSMRSVGNDSPIPSPGRADLVARSDGSRRHRGRRPREGESDRLARRSRRGADARPFA